MAALSIRLSATTLRERLGNWRSQLVADARFQRWAIRFPLTRRMANRNARALFDICAGFVYSQILSACSKLEVFELLRLGPKDCHTLAAQMGLTLPAARTLLKGATSLRLLRALPGDRFALDDLGAAMIGNPAVGALVAHHDLLYADLADPVALLRGERETALSRFWSYAANRLAGDPASHADGEGCAPYSDLMTRTHNLVADAVIDAYPLARHRRLMDVGGGEGAFLAAAARSAPNLALILFDLPPVAERARAKLAELGLSGRVETIGGDMLNDPLPRGADVVSLVRVLHDHDDESVRRLLVAIRNALPPGGALIVAEPMSGVRGAEPMGDAYFGLYLWAMGRGRPRTAKEIGRLLRDAGFRDVRELKTRAPLLASLMSARRV